MEPYQEPSKNQYQNQIQHPLRTIPHPKTHTQSLLQISNPNPNTIQDALLKEFVDEAKDLSKNVEQTITKWKVSNKDGIHLGKNTSASLELLREALTDKIKDVNETWADLAGIYTGNKITQNALSRAVQGAGRLAASSIRQIEEFQSDWQESIE